MRVVIEKGRARGRVVAPPSKSMAHRLLIAAGLSKGESRISGVSVCDDALASIDCLKALGASVRWDGADVIVRGCDPRNADSVGQLGCRESGSTLRFFVPIALLTGVECNFTGTEKLMSRPLSVYEEICRERGFEYRQGKESLSVRGRLVSGDYYLPGNVSSQFITGLLFALPLCEGESRIHITTKLESRSYIDLTLAAMREFSVEAEWEDEQTLFIGGSQEYRAHDTAVEGDYSGAAFLLALNCIGGEVTVEGLNEESLQGDRVCGELMRRIEAGYCSINIEDCPDLAPILFSVAAVSCGAEFIGTRRLRIKESDRAAVMARELGKLGCVVTVNENSVIINKSALKAPKEPLYGHNDHRIVMSMAVLCTLLGGEICGAEAVKKSYPSFFEDIEGLGIKVKRYEI